MTVVFGSPEQLPEFNFIKFMTDNLKYLESAKKGRIEGQVFVRFWIDTLGNTSEHKIIKGVRADLDEEALRVAKLIKFDKPAMNRGKPIGMIFMLPITFKNDSIKNEPNSCSKLK